MDATDGRDKAAKSVQFGSRLLAYYTVDHDKALSEKLGNLSSTVGDGRKLFRFFKGVADLQKLLVAANSNSPTHIKALTIMCRWGYFNFWLWDHLLYLSKHKVVALDHKSYGKNSGLGFFVGTVCALMLDVINYSQIIADIKKTPRDRRDERRALHVKRVALLLSIIAKVGDLIVSAQLAELPQRILGESLPEPLVAFGGLIAGVLVSYANWKAAAAAVKASTATK